jgi:hypothetical protein
MKRTIFVGSFVVAVLLFSSCIINWDENGSNTLSNSFNYSLRGTWKTLPSAVELKIEHSNISISGTIPEGKPLYNFTINAPLDGYSEEDTNQSKLKEGNFKIKNANEWQSIPYVYEKLGSTEVLTLKVKGSAVGTNLVLYKQ